jgi:S1-C subfamily serine protease
VRPAAVAALSFVAAVLGGLLVVLALASTGQLGDGGSTTVVAGLPSEESALPAARLQLPDAKPLAGNDFEPARIYAARADGVVTIQAVFADRASAGGVGQGSGFVVSAEGYLLTNAHVVTDAGEADPQAVRGATEVYVEFRDGDTARARIVGWDLFSDVAVLKVEPSAHDLEPVPLGNSARVVVGEPVAAIGSPFGEESSLTVGVISATGRSIPTLTTRFRVVDAIQTDAPINRGNSGGPLFDARGRVIGINAQIRSESGNAEGVGFAVPINAARRSMREIVARGRVSYAYVGVSTEDLTPALARRLGYEVSRGALIAEVSPGPARTAGLRGSSREVDFNGRAVPAGGDVVIAIDGEPVRSGSDLVRIVTGRLAPGATSVFTLLRDGKRVNVVVRPVERPIEPARD